MKKSRLINQIKELPHFLVFHQEGPQRCCKVVMLKAGDTFDQKRSADEVNRLRNFRDKVDRLRIADLVDIRVCCFYQEDTSLIVQGFKNKIKDEEALTGQGLCQLLGLKYDAIVEDQTKNQSINRAYFLSQIRLILGRE